MTRRGFLVAVLASIAGALAVLIPQAAVAPPSPPPSAETDQQYVAALRRVLHVRES